MPQQHGISTLNVIWANWKRSSGEQLMRFLLNCYHQTSSVSDMLAYLCWKPLELRGKTLRLCLMSQIHNRLVALDGFKSMEPFMPRRSRHLNSLTSTMFPARRTHYHLYSFFPRTIRDWNGSPDEVVRAPSLASFQ